MSNQPQLMEVSYIVKKKFKYDGKIFRVGQTWQPGGGKFDQKIIDQEDLVYEVQKPAPTPKQKTTTRRRKT